MSKQKPDVVILGCGPAGLLVAHAAAQLGKSFVIVSDKVKTPTNGAMYLHEPIEGITAEPFEITYTKTGSAEGYAQNVYGDPEAPVSWRKFARGPALAWSLPDAYARLWDLYSDSIRDETVAPDDVSWFADLGGLCISTIPIRSLCTRGHEFPAQKVYIYDYPIEALVDDNEIWYNGVTGLGAYKFYRASSINGIQSVESRDPLAGGRDERIGWKPLGTNCDCHPEVVRIGRFGLWDKNVLLHHVYQDAKFILKAATFTTRDGVKHEVQ